MFRSCPTRIVILASIATVVAISAGKGAPYGIGMTLQWTFGEYKASMLATNMLTSRLPTFQLKSAKTLGSSRSIKPCDTLRSRSQ